MELKDAAVAEKVKATIDGALASLGLGLTVESVTFSASPSPQLVPGCEWKCWQTPSGQWVCGLSC